MSQSIMDCSEIEMIFSPIDLVVTLRSKLLFGEVVLGELVGLGLDS